MICGHTKTHPRPQVAPKHTPATCPHENVDYRGSNRRVHKTWCKDCQSYIEEIPQHEWKAKQDVAHAVAASSTHVVEATSRVVGEVSLTVDAAKEVVKQFVRIQNRSLLNRTHVSSTELISCLQDCIDTHNDDEDFALLTPHHLEWQAHVLLVHALLEHHQLDM